MTDELVTLTKAGAAFDSDADAEETIEATLEALGAGISAGEASDIAKFLPDRFADHLHPTGDFAEGGPAPYDDFLAYIADETGVDADTAERRARAVVAALARIVGEPELDDARSQLSPEYGNVFETGGALLDESFADAVADATDLHPDEAEDAAEATLETLGERLSRGESEDIAHYLRGDARNWIVDEERAEPEGFPPEEFVDRVARRADVGEEEAREYVEAVSHTLAGVVPDRERDRAAAQIPDEYGSLLAPLAPA